MALLNAISLQMFQNKMKISPTVLPVSPGKFLKICAFSTMMSALVTTVHYNNGNVGRPNMDLE